MPRLLGAACAVALAAPAAAEVPDALRVGGTLATPSGEPLDGEHDLVLTFYRQTGRGPEAVQQRELTIAVEDGRFAAEVTGVRDLILEEEVSELASPSTAGRSSPPACR